MDNSLIFYVFFGIRSTRIIFTKFSTVLSFLELFFKKENMMFSALRFNGIGMRLQFYRVVGYVVPLKFKM